jgi:PAS domain S-box-containing protein
LQAALGITFFIIITLTVIMQITYNYYNTKKQLINEIENNINVSTLQLQKTLISFIESYQVTEYEKLVQNEMAHNNLLAIIVEDYMTGTVLGEKVYITGVIKDKNFLLADFDIKNQNHKKILKDSSFFKQTILIDKNNERIGKLIIYGTDKFIKKDLNQIIINNILVTVFIYAFIFLILYSLIKKVLIDPIKNIVDSLAYTNDSSIIVKKIDEHNSKEFSFLSNSINSMVEEIKTSQKELEKSNFRWHFAVEGSGDGLWDWDLKTNKVFFSKKWKEMLGFKEDEIENTLEEWERRVHPDDIEDVYKDLNKHLTGETTTYKNEHRVKCKNNTYKWILDRGIIVDRDDKNNPLRLIGTHTDITERKIHEKEMKQALTVFENTHDGILITNSRNEIININPAFTNTTGYTLDEIKYNTPSLLKSSKHDNNFYEKMWKDILEKGYWSGEIINKNKSGNDYEEYLTINTIKNKSGQIENFIGIFSDISMLKQQEKMLLQQARTAAVGEMIGNIAHQWRQPLSMISTISTGTRLQIELNNSISNDELIKNLDLINNHTQRLSTTIDDFRNFFKGDTSHKSNFNINEVIKKVEELTKDSFKNNFVTVIQDIQENIVIDGNENLLTHALINIYNNALDALKAIDLDKKRLFFISLKKEDSKIIIEMKDNAGGIDKNYLERIFEPYFTTKHESLGTGLGLYMTHQIITKQFHGILTAKNIEFTYENKDYIGADFLIEL